MWEEFGASIDSRLGDPGNEAGFRAAAGASLPILRRRRRSGEHRWTLVAVAALWRLCEFPNDAPPAGEDAKIAVWAIRQEARKRIEVTGRGSHRGVQEATDAAVAKIDRLVKAKIEEVGA
jgi:hypothetical protein